MALSLRPTPACAEAIPAGRYPAPFVHGARTFLPGTLSSIAGTAVRPTDIDRCGGGDGRRQVRRAVMAVKKMPGPVGEPVRAWPLEGKLKRVLEG